MSRWVRCSNGKRAGFVGAKIYIIIETSKFSGVFFISLHVLEQNTGISHRNLYISLLLILERITHQCQIL